MRILSLDIGTKKTGLALSSLDRNLIFPLPKIVLKIFSEKQFFDSLKKVLNSYWNEIDFVIVGDGSRISGSDNFVIKYIDRIIKALKSWTSWKIVLVREENSSLESKNFLQKLNFSKNKIKKFLDSFAALILLKDYFDSCGQEVMISF